MPSVCSEIIDDIEDLISCQDIGPKERYSSRKSVTVRVKKKQCEKTDTHKNDVVNVSLSSIIPGTHTIYVKTWGCTHNSSDSEYMAGQLAAYGYKLTESKMDADLWILNSCTVKNPAEDHFRNEIENGRKIGKKMVVAGCVPQGAPKSNFLKGLSMIGVQQIDRVVEVVEETLKGHSVQLLGQKKSDGRKIGGAPLGLPKIRKNPLIEIIPINTGCLNQCTYCKTKHARGDLGSYKPEEIVERARQSFSEGVCELWLTSEDTGTYGRDIGSSLPELLWKVIEVIPPNCMMRVGMTNPPYILEHLEEMAKILSHPRVYSFLHVPVQSGSDAVLTDMKREYNRADFENVVDYLQKKVPGVTIATDLICGFPTETEEDFNETLSLCQKYKFVSLFINQFYPRPGTPAARLPRLPAAELKRRTKVMTEFFKSYELFQPQVGTKQNVLVTEEAHDGQHYVAHNKFYHQVLVEKNPKWLGKMLEVKITTASKHSMVGEVLCVVGETPATLLKSDAFDINSAKSLPYTFFVIIVLVIARLFWVFFL
ncbi:threonylcarbamoyladenosine tRNA methylthiotransferase isoform X1 [Nilaparvata lugens]|uniref:threonylcarbamoyladenosine tRNA methylthiotransferase isoform X1 n=1 Tax=Nilaparvata lugens TaxID=108931 RepID=UPI000B989673|nr:threonylcarbamoyladenosine tRNA methylthiotransferase isoform X1 [Nilaparvata lugens]